MTSSVLSPMAQSGLIFSASVNGYDFKQFILDGDGVAAVREGRQALTESNVE